MKRKRRKPASPQAHHPERFFQLPNPTDDAKLARIPKPHTPFITQFKQNAQHVALLALIDAAQGEGITRNESAELLGFNLNAVNARLDELVKAGLLVNDYKRICHISKNKITAYRRP